MLLEKKYYSLEDAAKSLSCTEHDLLQFAAYGQIELCVLIPRNAVTPMIRDESGELLAERAIPAIHCGPCALHPLQWRAFNANNEYRTYYIKRIYSDFPPVVELQNRSGFQDWMIVQRTDNDEPLKLNECKIVLRVEELERVALEQKTGNRAPAISDNTLISVIAALLANWPNGKPPSGKDLERAAASVGVLISDDSIRKALKAARELAPSLSA